MRKFGLLGGLITIILVLSACASEKDKIAAGSEKDIYQRAQYALNHSSWDAAVEYLQLLEEHYPFGVYAEQLQLELIFAYYQSDEHEAAIASADRFIRLHPQHRSVDYAYYMRGVASFSNDTAITSFLPTDVTQRDIGTAREAFNYFNQFLNRYPDSPYALDAQKRMIYLRNTMARSEIHVANYYFKREAYLAAANRGRYVVENMQGTPAVPDGLAVMAMGYHMLNMPELADDAVKVLIANYPNHPAIKNGKFNFEYSTAKKRSWVSYVTFGLFDKRPVIKFDSRKQYDPFYAEAPPAPPAA